MLRALEDASVDSIVTDPPYELGFMGKAWDASGVAYDTDLWREALRVLKPGGHLLAFGGTRTYHRLAVAIEDAGFEVRDSIHWLYGSGFPKSLDVSKAIDKAAGAEREVVGDKLDRPGYHLSGHNGGEAFGHGLSSSTPDTRLKAAQITAPATDAARTWEGWGTALKPAHEPIVVARKPLAGTVAATVLEHGTGALNIDECRVGTTDKLPAAGGDKQTQSTSFGVGLGVSSGRSAELGGRWPANLVLTHAADCADECAPSCPVAALDAQSDASRFFTVTEWDPVANMMPFRYVAKPAKGERNAGLDGLEEKVTNDATPPGTTGSKSPRAGANRNGAASNHHPTVKPLALMRWLVRLVTPPGGTVLEPFAGSGTTLVAAVLEGFSAIGVEMTAEYLPIIHGRLEWARQQPQQQSLFDEGAA